MKGWCSKVWKKKMAVALSVAFLAGSLMFGSTASAYIINVGMEDLAAKEKTADSDKKQEKKVESAKEHRNSKDKGKDSQNEKQDIKPLQDKKADAAAKKQEKKTAGNDAKKAMEEAPKSSAMPVQQKKVEGTKLPVQNKKTDEPKIPVQEKKAGYSVQGSKDSVKTKKNKEKDRFQEIFRDSSFVYYMDTRSVRNVPIPNRQDRMIDVWVKLKPNSFSDAAEADTGKYYLEHYYINPKSKQIQFLCELEVTGRPSNAIKERPYSSQNWENLVPGSVEDDIYHAVVKKAKESSSIGGMAVPSASDILDMLNIGL